MKYRLDGKSALITGGSRGIGRAIARSLVFFGAWANHCSFYPGSSATLRKFQSDLKGFQVSKGTIRFSPDNPLPLALVKKLVNARIAQNHI